MESPPLTPSPSQSPVSSRRGWFKRLRRRSSFWPWKLRFSFSSSWRWNRLSQVRFSVLNELIFRILYVLEAIVLISTFCFFYLFCGCHV
ncbi:hypothetical protein MA16_Dca005458 [Dendrobium catenatum]|uniref:Uncharacterized protein n=1 Tax=Dendrobium catenatum TaxID=906689 RepID=A0A2I0X3G7_9ASPA|nr:hypothetical protein MA16_Dca005458 [Dendrobium catenatum]